MPRLPAATLNHLPACAPVLMRTGRFQAVSSGFGAAPTMASFRCKQAKKCPTERDTPEMPFWAAEVFETVKIWLNRAKKRGCAPVCAPVQAEDYLRVCAAQDACGAKWQPGLRFTNAMPPLHVAEDSFLPRAQTRQSPTTLSDTTTPPPNHLPGSRSPHFAPRARSSATDQIRRWVWQSDVHRRRPMCSASRLAA